MYLFLSIIGIVASEDPVNDIHNSGSSTEKKNSKYSYDKLYTMTEYPS